jgi:hypothetical protein
MPKCEWRWDLNKDNKWDLSSAFTKIPSFYITRLPSIEWFLFKVQDRWWLVGQSQGHCLSRTYLSHGSSVTCRVSGTVVTCWPKSRSFLFLDSDYGTFPSSMGRAWLRSLGLLSQSQGLSDSEEMFRSDIICPWWHYMSTTASRPNGSRNWMRSNRPTCMAYLIKLCTACCAKAKVVHCLMGS